MIDLCVINYNTVDKLERLCDTLYGDRKLSRSAWRLWVADNASTDGSGEWMKRRLIEENCLFNDNIGYARACNQLAALGAGDIIGLLNADVWLTTQDVCAIQKSFDDHPEMAIMGPKQRDEMGRVTHGGIFGTNTAPRHRGWKVHDPEDVLFRDREPAVTVSGSAYFVRRSTWDALTNDPEYQKLFPGVAGAFLPTPHYYEETWCSYFARHRGFEVFYDGTVSIGHSWHASSTPGEGPDKNWHISQGLFRQTCDALGIAHD